MLQPLPLTVASPAPPPRGVESRITQEALRRHVLRVLRCWRERYVFGDEFLNGLQVQPVTQRSSIANDSLPKVQNLMCC